VNLYKRSVRVILPVILLSYCIAVAVMYLNQREAVRSLEQTRLELTLQGLSASLHRYSAFAESVSHSIIHNPSFIHSLKSPSIKPVIDHIDTYIADTGEHLRLSSLSHFAFYYYDTNDALRFQYVLPDGANHVDLVSRKKAVPSAKQWRLVADVNDLYTLIFVQNIDAHSTIPTTEISLDNENHEGHMVVHISPDDFVNTKNQAESVYGVKIILSHEKPLLTGAVSASERVFSDAYLSINLPDSYIAKLLKPSFIRFVVIMLVFFILSYLLLIALIKKYITYPIAELDRNVDDVIAERSDTIYLDKSYGDEIFRLGVKFNTLYQKLTETINDTKMLAERDSLTNLYNFAFMSTKIASLIDIARENKTLFAIVYIDLDNFKVVNDKYGHDVGDKLLKSFSRKLLSVVRESDLVFENDGREVVSARIGGDEFCIVVVDIESIDVVRNVAQRVLSIFEKGYRFEQGTFPVTASVGVAIYPYHGLTISQLISNADTAMYHAKNRGKNQMAFYSESLAMAIRRRRDIEMGLKGLNCDHEFFVMYMPIVSANSKEVYALEALVRWQSPRLGLIGPSEFIPIAETCGLFSKVDYWVIDRVFQEVNVIKQSVPHDIRISINVSSANLNDNALLDEISRLYKLYEVEPSDIVFEITESFCIDFSSKAKAIVDQLIDMGFGIAIDDFGAGYTSLSQLLDYNTHFIKLDRTFIHKILLPESRNLLKPIVDLCHMKSLKVIAEGVETTEQVAFLCNIGCDFLQGYEIGEPQYIEALLAQKIQ